MHNNHFWLFKKKKKSWNLIDLLLYCDIPSHLRSSFLLLLFSPISHAYQEFTFIFSSLLIRVTGKGIISLVNIVGRLNNKFSSQEFGLVVKVQHVMCGLSACHEFEPCCRQNAWYLSGEGYRINHRFRIVCH